MKKYLHFIFGVSVLFSCVEEKQRELNPAPEIIQVEPSSGLAGDVITITGKRFLENPASNAVTFGGIVAQVQSVVDDSQLKVIVPEGALTGNIVVGNDDAATNGPLFTVRINRNPPTIISVSNQSLEIGEVLVITGTSFVASENADSVLNEVWLGNKRMPVVKATATQLTAIVPPGIVGTNQDLIVKVQGISSSAIKISVSGFSSTLYWILLPTENISNDKINQLIVRVAADGSTVLNARESVVIPDDSSSTRAFLKYSLSGPKAFSSKSNRLYYVRTDRSDSLLRLTTPTFNQFEKVLSDEEAGGVLPASKSLAVREGSQEVFYAYGDQSIINRGNDFFGFVTSGNASTMAAGSEALYLLVKDVSGMASLQKILYTTPDGSAEVVNTTSLPISDPGAAGIVSIQYSARMKSLYFVYQQRIDAPLQLYQLNELDGEITLLADNLPLLGNNGQSKFALLDATSGPKIYGIGFPADNVTGQSAGSQLVYMVNLKPSGQNNYQPVILYRDILKLPGRSETFQLFPSNITGELPFSEVDFLFVDDN